MTKQSLIETFIDLVKINSETKHERKIADHLINLFFELGLEVTEDEIGETTDHEAGNLIVRYPANQPDKPAIFFTAHMDTVTPGIEIQPEVKTDYIYSDGTTILGADDKAGVAAMIEAIKQLSSMSLTHGDIYFVITTGEESGLIGSKYFSIERLPVSYGYALDSDGDVGHIVTTAPAQRKIFATITGKSAHAGVQPEKGVSAISITQRPLPK
ncbi:hypothetical protein J416_05313 [Gracilibacillus halophilus YIM-C55.5]|uniref:Peptidase M28 domain-containing protein n=1 Tax=Gracilibacillus halophilus YIM-C55.5 TaxID=1308866 RepID=N4WSQ4_9BACI|nr:hypothetical protein J416_05313 [Gracilibacillus halophilus YIM-C55.5]